MRLASLPKYKPPLGVPRWKVLYRSGMAGKAKRIENHIVHEKEKQMDLTGKLVFFIRITFKIYLDRIYFYKNIIWFDQTIYHEI